MKLSQKQIVLALSNLNFAASAVFLHCFLAPNNLAAIVRSVSVPGILAVGMAIANSGRGGQYSDESTRHLDAGAAAEIRE